MNRNKVIAIIVFLTLGCMAITKGVQAAPMVDKGPFQLLWDTIENLQMQINNIQLTPGPPGPEGPEGPIGPEGLQGEPGESGIAGIHTVKKIVNDFSQFNNYVDLPNSEFTITPQQNPQTVVWMTADVYPMEVNQLSLSFRVMAKRDTDPDWILKGYATFFSTDGERMTVSFHDVLNLSTGETWHIKLVWSHGTSETAKWHMMAYEFTALVL